MNWVGGEEKLSKSQGLQQSTGTISSNHINNKNRFEETNSIVGLLAKCDYWLYDLRHYDSQRILFQQFNYTRS